MKSTDTSKLPKWAQDRIKLLERTIQDRDNELAKHGKLLEYSEAGVGYGCGMERRSIPSDYISYVTKSGLRFNLSLNAWEQLEINVSGYNQGHPVVFPRSSNHVFIGICPQSP